MAIYLDHNATSPMHPEVTDAISFCARKLRLPQRVGAPVVNRKPRNLLISGGYQEPVGLDHAAQVSRLEMGHKKHHLEDMRKVFEARLATFPGSRVFGQHAPGSPNTAYFALPYYHGETLSMELEQAFFARSSGAACHSKVARLRELVNKQPSVTRQAAA